MEKHATTFLSKNYENFDATGYLYQLVTNRKLINLLHSHNFFEILFVLNGSAVHCLNEQKQLVQKNELIFLSPTEKHCFESQSDDLYIFSLSITPEKFSRFLATIERYPSYGSIYHVTNPKIVEQILLLPTLSIKQQKIFINSILASLLFEAGETKQEPHVNIPSCLQIALETIRQPAHICGGVEELASLTGYSRMHLNRIVKKYYQKKPYELLCDIKMSLAIEYLKTTFFSIELIAKYVGFSSTSQFYCTFKKYFHITPYEYRKKIQTGEPPITLL